MTESASYSNEVILVARVGANAGQLQVTKFPCGVTDNALVINAKEWNDYIYYFLQYYNLNRLVFGSGQPLITGGMLKKIKVMHGVKSERNKITRLLGLMDERIATQDKIIEKLETLIKGLADTLLDNPLWEKTYLRSFMQFFSTNSLSWEQLSYEEGVIRNLHYGLIHGFQASGIGSMSLPKIRQNAIPKQYTLCQIGDVAFADASEDTSEIGKSVEFVDTIDSETVCGLHTIHGRDVKDKTFVGFKGFAFNSRYFHNQVKRLAQGTKVFSITANNLSSCYIYLPDMAEQRTITGLLYTYENQISISRKLLQQLKIQKKYLLQHMFI